MRLSTSLRFLVENLVWVLGSLLLAAFVWIAATIEQNPVESRRFPERIPIEIVTEDGMIVTNNPIGTAQIVLRTQSTVWSILEAEDIVVTADLTGLPAGTHAVDLDIQFNNVNRIVLEDYQPRQITVIIDQAAEILAPVNADVRATPATGFEISSITFSTQEISVTGPASAVEQVVSAEVRLYLSDERDPVTRNLRLYPVDGEGNTISGVTITPETISVTVDVQPREDFREVFVTPNIVGEPASGYVIYRIDYEPQTILVSGRPTALEQIPGTIATAPIDLTGQTSSFSRTVSVQLPEDVFLPTEQNVTVSVEIDTLTASRQFEHLPVQVQGLDSSGSMEASITPSEVTMLITGPQPILDTLTPADISILADLTDLAPGAHQVTLQPVVNREGLESAVISVLPPSLDVEIRALDMPPTPVQPLPAPSPG
jgi:YbbR domain-containing protein